MRWHRPEPIDRGVYVIKGPPADTLYPGDREMRLRHAEAPREVPKGESDEAILARLRREREAEFRRWRDEG